MMGQNFLVPKKKTLGLFFFVSFTLLGISIIRLAQKCNFSFAAPAANLTRHGAQACDLLCHVYWRGVHHMPVGAHAHDMVPV